MSGLRCAGDQQQQKQQYENNNKNYNNSCNNNTAEPQRKGDWDSQRNQKKIPLNGK